MFTFLTGFFHFGMLPKLKSQRRPAKATTITLDSSPIFNPRVPTYVFSALIDSFCSLLIVRESILSRQVLHGIGQNLKSNVFYVVERQYDGIGKLDGNKGITPKIKPMSYFTTQSQSKIERQRIQNTKRCVLFL